MSKLLTELLGPDEHVVLQTRQHWWVLFVDAALQMLGMLVVGAALIFATRSSWFDNHRAGGWVINALWVVIGLLALVLIWKVLTWLVQKFTITTTKVVYQHGLIQRDVISVPLVKLDEVTLVQPILGRVLRFGRLDVENASGGKAPLAGLEYLPRPTTIYREITERARQQRLLEGGGYQDADGDGRVDAPKPSRDTAADPDGPHVVHTETTTTETSSSDGGGDGGGSAE